MIQFYEFATDDPIAVPEDFPLGWRLLKRLPAQGGRRQDFWSRMGRKIFCIVPESQPIYTVTASYPTMAETVYCFYDPIQAHLCYVGWVDNYPEIDYEEGTL